MPINPEWIPEMALMIAGVIAGAFALHLLFTRQLRQAMKLGAASLALIALAFALGNLHLSAQTRRQTGKPRKPIVLSPAAYPQPDEKDPEAAQSMSLLLGDVLLRVAPSDRYVLSVDGVQFLALDSLKSGLIVSCEVAGHDDGSTHSDGVGGVPGSRVPRSPWLAARIVENWFAYCAPGIQPSRPDAHTLLVRRGDSDIFRMRYAEPRKIEITGEFLGRRYAAEQRAALISFKRGIHWYGGGVLPGTIDLRLQGRGRIDFQRSGLIQVLPY
jgi:hypothetical protein